jgi:hypothetical protein
MASSGKRKTTMAKLARERKLMERRLDKQARKEARKRSAAGDFVPDSDAAPMTDQTPPETPPGEASEEAILRLR